VGGVVSEVVVDRKDSDRGAWRKCRTRFQRDWPREGSCAAKPTDVNVGGTGNVGPVNNQRAIADGSGAAITVVGAVKRDCGATLKQQISRCRRSADVPPDCEIARTIDDQWVAAVQGDRAKANGTARTAVAD